MALTPATKETAALAVTGLGGYISLHTADPGTTGTAEVTGGSPAYARKQSTWAGGAPDGEVTGSEVAIDVPPGTYEHFGLWSAATGGTFLGGGSLTKTVLASQGQIRVQPTFKQS